MNVSQLKSAKYSVEEYIEIEKNSEERFEYFDGKIWNGSLESETHCLIAGNIQSELKNQTRNTAAKVYSSNLKIKVPVCPTYRYADAAAVRGKPLIERFYTFELLINPSLIVEVLSPSTEAFDLNAKFTYYKSIESLTEYLLIAHEFPHATLYTKQTEEVWLHREYNSLDATIYLSSLDCEISMAEIYLDIEFDEASRPPFRR